MDKDLASIQEVRDLIKRAKEAQKKLGEMSQEQIDVIVEAIAEAGCKNAEQLGKMANEETGFGKWEDKKIKNIFASKVVHENIKDMKTVGVINDAKEKRVMDIAVPMGVVAGLIPSTNPTSTAIYKVMISIKSGNSIVVSPHPGAKNCIIETVKIISEAAVKAGMPEGAIGCITIPTLKATDQLMKHKDTAVILATGGSAMVKAAYSSGTPAIGVGPGNGPAFIERTADVKLAVKRILDSKTFDNGTICASEQSIIAAKEMEETVVNELKSQGAYFLSTQEANQLSGIIMRANGTMNPQIVGKSVQTIAALAKLSIPQEARVLIAYEKNVGRKHPYSCEKLAPILGFFVEDNTEAVMNKSIEILTHEGAGHTFIIHSKDEAVIRKFAQKVPVSRFLINTPGSLGGIGATTNMVPALTLGCGAVGGSSKSENIGPMDLLNIRKATYGVKEIEDIRPKGTSCPSENAVDEIVRLVLSKLINQL